MVKLLKVIDSMFAINECLLRKYFSNIKFRALADYELFKKELHLQINILFDRNHFIKIDLFDHGYIHKGLKE